MKVLHVAASLSPAWGGPVPVVKGLTEAMARKGVEVTVFATFGQTGGLVQLEGVEVRLFKQNFLSRIWKGCSLKLVKTLYQEIERFDLTHIQEIWHYPHFAAYLTARKARKPYIVTIHGALEPWCLNYKGLKKKIYAALIQRRILNKAAAIHAITQEEVEHIKAFGVDRPIIVIPNGINPKEFSQLPPKEELKKLYPELQDEKVVLFLGRIHPKKGLDILARAFGKIARDRKDVHLLIVGPDEGGYRREVEKMLAPQNVIEKTTFTGMLTGKEKLAALSLADIFVLPSYSEGFSMAILEALACGLPTIITRQCHFPEVAQAKAGIVIDPDPVQLAEALLRLLDDPELREEMGNNGRRLVMEKFTWDRIADQMIELYQRVLEGEVIADETGNPKL